MLRFYYNGRWYVNKTVLVENLSHKLQPLKDTPSPMVREMVDCSKKSYL